MVSSITVFFSKQKNKKNKQLTKTNMMKLPGNNISDWNEPF